MELLSEAPVAKQAPILSTPDNLKLYGTLVSTSNRSSLEVDIALPWANGIDKAVLPKRAEHSWIYGTRYWDMLTDEQKHELLWLENGRDVTAFIKLERYLPILYVGYILKYRDELPKEIYDYLLIFSKEEIVHTMMFKRYMKLAQLPMIMDPESPFKAFLAVVGDMKPVFGIFFTLVLEWAAELNAVHLSQYEGCEPLTKRMFREHHVEEVRHIAFGKRIVEDFFEQGDPEEVARIREQFKPIVQGVYDEITFNRMMEDFTSFKFPVSKDDKEAIQEIRTSEHNRKLNAVRFKDLNDWLAKLGFE